MKRRRKRGLAFLLAASMFISCLNGSSLISYAAEIATEEEESELSTASVPITVNKLQELVNEIQTRNNTGEFTATSWEESAIAEVITNANSAINSSDETAVAEAYEDLRNAYCNLVPQINSMNYALGKTVTAAWVGENTKGVVNGDLSKITNGNTSGGDWVIFGNEKGNSPAYIQIDLGREIQLDKIVFFRYRGDSRIYSSTAAVVSLEKDFSDVTKENVLYYSSPSVTTEGTQVDTVEDIFGLKSLNSENTEDIWPSNKLYKEGDYESGKELYTGSNHTEKITARYVRIYANGRYDANNPEYEKSSENHPIELQVWGKPVDLYNLKGLQTEATQLKEMISRGNYQQASMAGAAELVERAEALVTAGVEEGSTIEAVQTLLWELEEAKEKLVVQKAQVGVWSVTSLTEEERKAYDDEFFVTPASATEDSSIGHWGSSVPGNAIDENLENHWEANRQDANGVYLQLNFNKTEEIGQLIYRVRRDASGKGFPLKFKVQASHEEHGDVFWDVAEGSASHTMDYVKITFDEISCKRIRLVWQEATNGWPSASVLYCYKEDNLAEQIMELFADNACTVLKENVSQDEINVLKEKIAAYPVPGNMNIYIEIAELLLSGRNSDDRIHEQITLSQGGDRTKERNRTGLTMTLSSWDLTGYYVRPGDVLDIFVDADANGPMPRLVLAAVGRNYSWQYGYDGMALSNGHNRITVPETMQGCQAIYFYNPALPDDQAYAPIVRLCGGNKYPVYFYNEKDSQEEAKAKEAVFIEEVTQYCEKVENDLTKAALGEGEPNICEYVSDKVLISTTAKGVLNSFDEEFTWNKGKYREWIAENTVKHAVVERDDSNQVTGIRFAGPAAVMEAWEIMFKDMQLYCGFNITDPAHEDYRNHGKFVFRAYTDGAGAGWGQNCYSGYNAGSVAMDSPMNTGWFESLVTSNAVLTGSWTEYHELGHLFDSGLIGSSESTNNLFGLSAQRKYLDSTRMEDEDRWWLHFTTYFNTRILPINDELFYPGAVIIQLDGVDFSGKSIYAETDISNYGRACRYARLHQQELAHLSKNDKLVVSFSMACGVDLSSHFEFYGRELSQEAKLLLNGLPKEERPTYLVNNRTFNGGAFSEEDKAKTPRIASITSDADTGAVSIEIEEGIFAEENLQCFAIYRQKVVDGELVGDAEWIGITGDSLETKDVNELYQFTDVNVVPGDVYEYSIGVFDCKLMENENKDSAQIAIDAGAEIPVNNLVIADGDEGYTFSVGQTKKIPISVSPVNSTVNLNELRVWVAGYGRDDGDEDTRGGGPDIITLEQDPDYPNDPTKKVIKGIQWGQTHIYATLGGVTRNYRIVVNGNLAVDDSDTTKYKFAFQDTRNTFQAGESYYLNLYRTTCDANGEPTPEVVKVATTPNGTSWESSNPEVVSVNNRGKITAVAAGEATISFKRGEETVATCVLTVVGEEVPLEEIHFQAQEEQIVMEAGESRQLTYSLIPADTTETAVPVFSSSDSNIVRVEQDGTITAIKGSEQPVTITIRIGNISATKEIIVNEYIVLKSLSFEESIVNLTPENNTKVMSVIKTPADATADLADAVWSSGNESVFTVQNGTITAVGTGTATLTVSLGGKTATAKVTVEGTDIELTGIGFRGHNKFETKR